METINKINVRVYGLLIIEEKLLMIKESYIGKKLVKFPGGGLEFGEGIIDCLKREFTEELNLWITSYEHFYTQEDFLQSRFHAHEQLITIYYKVHVENRKDLHILDSEIDELLWIPIVSLQQSNSFLPIDNIVIGKLIEEQKD